MLSSVRSAILGGMVMTLIVEDKSKVTIPDEARIRYEFDQDTPVRVIVTRRSDVLLVPLTDQPMGEVLHLELAGWQNLGMLSVSMLPYQHTVSPYNDDEEVRI